MFLCGCAYVYRPVDGWGGALWWALEAGNVVLAIAAMWMDAFRYRTNWIAWCLHLLLVALFWHGRLWGPFVTTFVYQAINF